MDDLHERLAGIEAARYFFAERPVPYALYEGFCHRQRDVCLEQSHADGPHGVADVFLGDPAAARHALYRARQAGCELVEHGVWSRLGRVAEA